MSERWSGRLGVDPARLAPWVLRLVGLVVVVMAPVLVGNAWLRVGQYVMIGSVGAIGLTLLTGQAGQLSLATPFFMFVGGITYCVLATPDRPGRFGLGLPSALALLGAVLVPAVLGLAFAPVAGRVRGVYLGVATLSLVYVGLYLGQRWTSISGGTASGRSTPDLNLFGLTFLHAESREKRVWYLFCALTALAAVLASGAVRSRPGRAWRAIRDNPAAAAALGVPVPRVRTEAFAVSSGYAGLAGVMTAMWYRLLKPDESEFVGTWSVQVAIGFLAMVLIGGLGSVGGAIAGAALVNGLPGALTLWTGGSQLFGSGPTAVTPMIFTSFVYGAAIILVVLFEPGGLAALARRVLPTLGAAPISSVHRPRKGI
ncbi:MAG TPA: branched-chain amino acid ABC transporter permease [Sporichthyaceae bacterium]|nr:branched-chain amino acid ABC transporter permease [Sporichthyaceae bacterium]